MVNYDTALRAYPSKRLEEIDSANILVGIPCYNNDKTIVHVIRMVTRGLAKHYKSPGLQLSWAPRMPVKWVLGGV